MVPITPKTKVGALLDAYPELEDVLIGIAPAFRKLKNPVLRRTIAKVATLQQAALTGEVPVADVVRRLREAVGQDSGDLGADTGSDAADAAMQPQERPGWLDDAPVKILDAGPMIDHGENPLHEAVAALGRLGPGEVLRIDAPFYPAPLVDTLRGMGHALFAEERDGTWRVSVRRSATP